MLAFLLVPEDEFQVDEAAAAKHLGADNASVLDTAVAAAEAVPSWTGAALEDSLKAALVDGLQLKPRHAFTPVRVAVTGRTVSPPLFESMEILGRERSLRRLRAALA
jgi:glutamyl-tRNA synthetase